MVLKKVGPDEFNISRSFKDVNISFAKNAVTKDTAIVKNENAIKQAIKNLVLTRPGEKHFQPEIGSEVYTLLFEPLDDFTAETIQDEIINIPLLKNHTNSIIEYNASDFENKKIKKRYFWELLKKD